MVKLNEAGVFSWSEWAQLLSSEIDAAGSDDAPDNYWMHWLAALERINESKGTMSRPERLERVEAWGRAAHATPHGQPIELGAERRSNSY